MTDFTVLDQSGIYRFFPWQKENSAFDRLSSMIFMVIEARPSGRSFVEISHSEKMVPNPSIHFGESFVSEFAAPE